MCWLRVLPSSGSPTDADDERSDTSTATSGDEMDLDPVFENTNNQYISLQEAGKGTCGKVIFCTPRPPPITNPPTTNPTLQSPGLVAIKISTREMSRDGIATEIMALRRIHSFFAAEDDRTIAKHLPNLVNFDPIVDGGSRWLAIHPIRGFDLERLRVVVTDILHPSSSTSATCNLPLPAIPEVLVLHIAKQLMEVVGWLHDVPNMAHNDVFGANVMLDLSTWNKAPVFTMPTIVLIDFHRAKLNPNEMKKGADRAFLYEFIYMLDRTGRALSQGARIVEDISTPTRSPTWWDTFMNFLNVNKGQYLEEETSTFARLRDRFGAEIDRRLEEVSGEEVRQVQGLLHMVAEKEVRFPSEDRISEVLEQWEDG